MGGGTCALCICIHDGWDAGDGERRRKAQKHKRVDQGAVQTFITIKNESKGKNNSIKGAEIKRHAISRR